MAARHIRRAVACVATSMDTMRALVRACRRPDGLDSTTTALVSLLPWLDRRRLDEFELVQPLGSGALTDRRVELASQSFHQRAGVPLQSRDVFARPVVRLAHQPNALAYGRLLLQFPAISQSAMHLGATPLYVFVDYDTCSDEKFARTHVPDPLVDSGLAPVGLTPRCIPRRSDLLLEAPPPPEDWVDHVRAVAFRSLRSCTPPAVSSREATAVRERLELLLEDLTHACRHGDSLADACAIFLCRAVNLRMRLAISFCPASALWEAVPQPAIEALLEAWPEIHSRISGWAARLARIVSNFNPSSVVAARREVLPIWWRCGCGTRVAIETAVGRREFFGTCPRCNTSVRMSLAALEQRKTVPRVVAHNALNRLGFGYAGGVNHLGSSDHVLTHGLALADAGWDVLPQALWQPAGEFGTWLERAARGRADELGWRRAAQNINDASVSSLYYLSATDPHQLATRSLKHLASHSLDAKWRLDEGSE